MRHEQIAAQESYTKVNVQALWPASAQIAPLPIPDVEQAASPAGSRSGKRRPTYSSTPRAEAIQHNAGTFPRHPVQLRRGRDVERRAGPAPAVARRIGA